MTVNELIQALRDLDAGGVEVVLEIRGIPEAMHILQTPLIDGVEVVRDPDDETYEAVIVTASGGYS